MITSMELRNINFNSKPNSLDPARRKLMESRFVVHEIHLSLLSGTSSFSLILQRKDYSRGSERQVAYVLMAERICQIKRKTALQVYSG